MPTLIGSITAAALTAALSTPAAGPAPVTPDPHPPTAASQQQPARAGTAHRFRVRFTDERQCRARGAHDHPGRPDVWDCRRGPDRAHPWEYRDSSAPLPHWGSGRR